MNNKNLRTMPRLIAYKTLLPILFMFLLILGVPAIVHSAAESRETTLRLTPDVLNGQRIYQSRHTTLELETWAVSQWKTIAIPETWGDANVYIELWDSENHRIQNFSARPLLSHSLDISTLDATLYPSFRVIIFQANSTTEWPVTDIRVTHTESFNTRFLVLLILVSLMILGLLIGAFRYRMTPAYVWKSTRMLLSHPQTQVTAEYILASSWLVVLWSAVFSVPLGMHAGGIQFLYLLVKLPLLFFCSFLISFSTQMVLTKLSGISASAGVFVSNALHVLAVTAVALAALSPIVWMLVLTHQPHDLVLVWALLLFCIAYFIGIVRLYAHYRILGAKFPLVAVAVWVSIYAIVLLQVGWMLRPWVGVVDPIQKKVPFTRLYSGNVFEEISLTINRLTSQERK
ncbi:MAG: hypothetical protein WC289_01050 [Patescibacteria group bacterium]|jgi:hypothetical protein